MQDKVIYFGRDDGNVYAVDAESGQQIWKTATRGPVPCTPAIDHGTVYVGSYDGKFYALDAQSGAVKWKFATEGERRFEAKGLHGWQPKNQTFADAFDVFLSSPAVVDGAVYFGSGDGNLYSLDANSGALRWKFRTGDVVHASPAIANGVAFVGSWDSYFYAVDVGNGKEKWRDRKSTRLNSSHRCISYAVFCLKKKTATPFTVVPFMLPRSATAKPSPSGRT